MTLPPPPPPPTDPLAEAMLALGDKLQAAIEMMAGLVLAVNAQTQASATLTAAVVEATMELAKRQVQNTNQAQLPEKMTQGTTQLPANVSFRQRAQEPPAAKNITLTALLGGIDMFKVQLFILLGPLASFATLLNQSSSGFRIFLSAISILAGTLAPVLLPVFLLLSAALLTLSDYIWSNIEPALEGFYTWLTANVINALAMFVDNVQAAYRALRDYTKDVKNAGEIGKAVFEDLQHDMAIAIATIIDMIEGSNLAEQLEKDREANRAHLIERRILVPNPQQQAPAQPAVGPFPIIPGDNNADIGEGIDKGGEPKPEKWSDTLRRDLLKNLRLSMDEFKFQNGPKASLTSLVGASKAAQLAGVSESPFEKVMAQRTQTIITKFDQALAKLDKLGMAD